MQILVICGYNLTAKTLPQNFSTPVYPRPYRNDISCEWIIAAPFANQRILLVFFDIDTEECCDHIKVSLFRCVPEIR